MIPVSRPDIGPLEQLYVKEAVASSWVAGGPFVEQFEREWAAQCGAAHGVACCNGTTALHLALRALGIGPGDEVIVPTLTYVATAAAVLYCGATPVFVGSDEHGCISPEMVAEARTERTKAVIAVHLYGHPADVDQLPVDLPIVEDAAEAHGAQYKGRPVGSLGAVATWSFYGNKVITCGEGGMVTTGDAQAAERLRFLRGQAQSPERRFWHTDIGYNYRLNNVSAAIGCAQIQRWRELQAKREQIAGWYRERIGDLMTRPAPWATPAVWLINVHVPNRDRVAERMAAVAIETRPWFPLVHTMPPYTGYERHLTGQAEKLSASGLSLPTSTTMSESDVECVCNALREAMK